MKPLMPWELENRPFRIWFRQALAEHSIGLLSEFDKLPPAMQKQEEANFEEYFRRTITQIGRHEAGKSQVKIAIARNLTEV